ncbi:uracil-DNA glycosylase [Jannaschia sp. S6380]|uniref:uracil-DNA glycosylase n=1 Tax=Jannaschia sp. S6380 TaxID=2926408 RepID=UPI001FF5233E|nr:uracil-DNA glycosylase [Jannaschia sp. S6380]MCK0169132.1 uracil-DNA glycosylase [Jannaschia sp. S6380]
MDSLDLDPFTARATLEWLVELGCDEAIGPTPVNRFDLPDRQPEPARPAPAATPSAAPPAPTGDDPLREAERRAAAAATIAELRDAVAAFPYCELRLGARATVFADGNPKARVMILGDAPDRDADRSGVPFSGDEGALLDRMLAAIGLARGHADGDRAAYLSCLLPWRPPSGREPEPEEIAVMMPFLERHVELADPKVLVLMGNQICGAVLGRRGVTGLRGTWTEGFGRPALPMLPPAYLMRHPAAKRDAWADLLELSANLARKDAE